MQEGVLSASPTGGRLSSSIFKRRLYLCFGFISLSVGLLGIILPILDTTPFMLLSAFCFARSSPKRHRWIICMSFLLLSRTAPSVDLNRCLSP
ncbi:YbaN family protein [Nitrospira defluvii]|nr:YbaN family protein [Nitrospira defluvii]